MILKEPFPERNKIKQPKFLWGCWIGCYGGRFQFIFSQYGTVIDAQLMIDTKTGKPRGFGFITFDSHEAVEKIVSEPVLILKEKHIEVKRRSLVQRIKMEILYPILTPSQTRRLTQITGLTTIIIIWDIV